MSDIDRVRATLCNLPVDWSSYDKDGSKRPSDVVVKLAESVTLLVPQALTHVAPMAGGGAALYWREGNRQARFEAENEDPSTMVVTTAEKDGEPCYHEVPGVVEAAAIVSRFLATGDRP